MKILLVSTVFEPSTIYGGPVQLLADIGRELVRQGHEVTVLTSNVTNLRPVEYRAPGQETRDGMQVQYLAAQVRMPHFSLIVSARINDWLQQRHDHFDLVHVNYGREFWPCRVVAWAMRNRIPYVLHGHGNFHRFGILHRFFDALVCRRQVARASAVIALQDDEVQQLQKVGGGRPIEILPNAIDMKRFQVVHWCRQRWEHKRLLFLGRLHTDKRIFDFLRMARELSATDPDLSFQIAGPDGGELDRARGWVQQHGLDSKIQFLGEISPAEVPGWLEAGSILVHPSIRESFGLAIFEALASCMPVILTTGCRLAPEIRMQNAAVVVEPGSQNLVHAARMLLQSPDRSAAYARAGRRFVEQHYSLTGYMNRLVKIYQGVLSLQ